MSRREAARVSCHRLTDALAIEWLDQEWSLLAHKALHWPAQRAVIIADCHFGKAAAFRHHGVPVPEGPTSHDLARLTAIVAATACEHLIVLGDLLHAPQARADHIVRAVAAWRARHRSLTITLVRGNHDLAAGDPPDSWRVNAKNEPWNVEGLHLRHCPAEDAAAAPALAGHVHPSVRLRDIDGSTTRLPCFIFSPRAALLPAFGSFTGAHPVKPRTGDRVFAVAHGEVHEIAPARRASAPA